MGPPPELWCRASGADIARLRPLQFSFFFSFLAIPPPQGKQFAGAIPSLSLPPLPPLPPGPASVFGIQL